MGGSFVITESRVEEIAKLAQLKLTPDEVKRFTEQLKPVIEYFDKLSKVDASKYEPLATPTEIEFHEREDVSKPFAQAVERVLANAPDKKNNLFKVPPVV